VLTLGMSGLIAAYVLIALLLLSINLYSKWSWPVKAATIIITSGFYAVSYYSFPALLGWPTTEAMPQKFKLNAVQVVQPDKQKKTKGKIYLWATELKDLKPVGMPRAYRLPYSEALFEKVNKARIKMSKGMEQLGEYKKPKKGSILIMVPKTSQVYTPIKFYDLPNPLYPEK
jgi:hypothetical protein